MNFEEDSASDLISHTDMVLAGGSASILRRKQSKENNFKAPSLIDLHNLLSTDIQSLIVEFSKEIYQQ